MQCRLLQELECPDPTSPIAAVCEDRGGFLFAPAGTVIDHPDAWRLVDMCIAEAIDEECHAAKTQRTPEQQAASERAAEELRLGIHPDDLAAFRAGEILGYDGSGNVIPGPNAKKPADPFGDDDEDDDESSARKTAEKESLSG